MGRSLDMTPAFPSSMRLLRKASIRLIDKPGKYPRKAGFLLRSSLPRFSGTSQVAPPFAPSKPPVRTSVCCREPEDLRAARAPVDPAGNTPRPAPALPARAPGTGCLGSRFLSQLEAPPPAPSSRADRAADALRGRAREGPGSRHIVASLSASLCPTPGLLRSRFGSTFALHLPARLSFLLLVSSRSLSPELPSLKEPWDGETGSSPGETQGISLSGVAVPVRMPPLRCSAIVPHRIPFWDS